MSKDDFREFLKFTRLFIDHDAVHYETCMEIWAEKRESRMQIEMCAYFRGRMSQARQDLRVIENMVFGVFEIMGSEEDGPADRRK